MSTGPTHREDPPARLARTGCGPAPPDEPLERLISRYLDGEAHAAERRELRRRLRQDPVAKALFEEQSLLDRQIARAMRQALRRPVMRAGFRSAWVQTLRGAALAAAACLATVAIGLREPRGTRPTPMHQAASLFLPVPEDSVRRETPLYARPGLPVQDSEREWILLPGERPEEYLVIEVNRIHTRLLRVHRDF